MHPKFEILVFCEPLRCAACATVNEASASAAIAVAEMVREKLRFTRIRQTPHCSKYVTKTYSVFVWKREYDAVYGGIRCKWSGRCQPIPPTCGSELFDSICPSEQLALL